MSQIDIKFLPRFEKPILHGQKTMTCRLWKRGEVGDHFYVKGRRFVIHSVERRPLKQIATECYALEGCETPSDFINVWNEIHSSRPYHGSTMVWAHQFSYEP